VSVSFIVGVSGPAPDRPGATSPSPAGQRLSGPRRDHRRRHDTLRSVRRRSQADSAASASTTAQIGVVGFDGPIDLQALRLYGLPEAAPAVLNGTPLLSGLLSGSGRREFAAEVCWELPSLAAGATTLLDVTVTAAWVGDLAQALLTSSRFFELDATAWSNNTVRVLARNVSNTTIDLGAATLSVQVTSAGSLDT
jgi:hypothetical protein